MQNIHAFKARSCDFAGVTVIKGSPANTLRSIPRPSRPTSTSFDGTKTSGEGTIAPSRGFLIDASLTFRSQRRRRPDCPCYWRCCRRCSEPACPCCRPPRSACSTTCRSSCPWSQGLARKDQAPWPDAPWPDAPGAGCVCAKAPPVASAMMHADAKMILFIWFPPGLIWRQLTRGADVPHRGAPRGS